MPPDQTPTSSPQTVPTGRKMQLPGSWKTVSLVLAAVIIAMVWLWIRWEAYPKAADRSVSVSGSDTVTAVPDEYVFSPSYQFSNASKQKAVSELTNKSDEIIAKLKSLGVADSKIKSNASNYDSGLYAPVSNGKTAATLSLTITVSDKQLAQKVQDYLVTTSPTGAITPQVSFSTAKQKALEDQARDKAEQDARAKAEQSAKNLGYKTGKVKSVVDGGFSGIGCRYGACPVIQGGLSEDSVSSSSPKLNLQPGENELTYNVTVVYYIK
jgi:uncharacterized protein YggE